MAITRGFKQPTLQQFLSGTAQTYNVPANCTRIKVKMIGGGGSGGGGSAGGSTTFGTSLFTCGGGSAGSVAQIYGPGGTPTIGTLPSGATALGLNGSGGGMGAQNGQDTYGVGGSSPLGGGGGANSAAAANTGGGGGGGAVRGGGGGAGAYIEAVIPNPLSSYLYSVGAGGTGGGNNGGSGIIIVEEFYD